VGDFYRDYSIHRFDFAANLPTRKAKTFFFPEMTFLAFKKEKIG